MNQSGDVDASSPPATVKEVDFFEQHEEFTNSQRLSEINTEEETPTVEAIPIQKNGKIPTGM